MAGIGPGPSPARTGSSAARAAALAAPAASLEPVQQGAEPAATFEDDDQTRISDGVGGLASAFSQAVVGRESSSLKELSVPADEWYVGINGVPVGPIRLSELRSKAAVGAITLDSLVWRDGFEEWQTLRTFPELVAIVEESLSSARASFNPLSPATAAAIGGAAVVGGAPLVSDPFTQSPGAAPVGALGAGLAGGQAGAGLVAPITGPVVVTEKLDDFEIPGAKRRGGSSPAAWIAVAIALMFGLTIGFVLFSRQAPGQQVVKYVEVPAKTAASQNTAGTEPETIEEATISASSKTGKKGSGGSAKVAAETPEAKGLSGLSGLSGLQGGPKSGPGSEASQGGSGQPLDSGTIQKTVSRYTGSVKRSCWQPALDTRSQDAPTSARVNVTITVAASGSVQGVSTSGEPSGYRGLAGCIAARVRGWQFPASSGTTTVNVPFVFAAQ
jgi:hypothetical protein